MSRSLARGLAGLILLPALAHAADGRTTAVVPETATNPLKELWSGYHYAPEAIKAKQDKDEDNPAMKLYSKGESLWSKVEGKSGKSCESCHGDAAQSMKGSATSYPAWFKLDRKPLTLGSRINLCREKYMQAKTFPPGSDDMLAIKIYVKRQSKGLPIKVKVDGPLEEHFQKGRDYYTEQRGQLGISCSGCHDRYAGKLYRSERLSQGHPNGFPLYRESWKETGSLLRQINQCLARVRANPLKAGSDEVANLELYLNWRANGLPVETPAVRE